ncbi:hypothetical protein DO72_4046 [Burkholderia pseudomallei]|nr:hypothetical protein DO65_5689 [Burkholderia pseudomallei]KGD35043.1 hypothetical protein DO72_4046 [Burkholderia pseudomallei]
MSADCKNDNGGETDEHQFVGNAAIATIRNCNGRSPGEKESNTEEMNHFSLSRPATFADCRGNPQFVLTR